MRWRVERNGLGRRRGNILVLSALLMVGFFGFLAFAVDLGYLSVVRAELQGCADAAAIAGAGALLAERASTSNGNTAQQAAVAAAISYAAHNYAGSQSLYLPAGDVTVGRLANIFDHTAPILTQGVTDRLNAVRVKAQRTAAVNGEVPTFFARVLGFASRPTAAEATAAFLDNFRGFRPPTDGSNLDILPFAIDEYTWNQLLAGIGNDDWTWNPLTKQVTAGRDGVLEVNLYPQGTGAPGNRGTVDIGKSNNSTADIARQILHGVSPQDLAYLGGKLELNEQGRLYLNGDTGISAGVKDELASIRGKPRIVLIFRSVAGPGNNATYTIVCLAVVRIMEVKLTGSMSSKRVIIQPAVVQCPGGIPNTGDSITSYGIYSPVRLVR
jgi:Flp pilus assembly protein TadG